MVGGWFLDGRHLKTVFIAVIFSNRLLLYIFIFISRGLDNLLQDDVYKYKSKKIASLAFTSEDIYLIWW